MLFEFGALDVAAPAASLMTAALPAATPPSLAWFFAFWLAAAAPVYPSFRMMFALTVMVLGRLLG